MDKCLDEIHKYISTQNNTYSLLCIFTYFLFYIFPCLFFIYSVFIINFSIKETKGKIYLFIIFLFIITFITIPVKIIHFPELGFKMMWDYTDVCPPRQRTIIDSISAWFMFSLKIMTTIVCYLFFSGKSQPRTPS